ncbi:MAG: LLM class flavin-dependent oxidoreductase [Dehalococcoidia bacterium]|nr:LLM class flavin-dependent oxidoreductase [Dehalococcoidia bacterium]
MVKVILQTFPVIPAAGPEERAAKRPIGRNVELYQETLRGWNEVIQAADELGLWGAGTIEHHFHSEGYEVGPSPGIMNSYWAAITKNIRVGQLGYVMSAQNPIRVAEDAAILDHLTKGRCFVGFARGYQARWTNIVGQHVGTKATISDGSSDDEINRRLFEEGVELVLKAWKQDSIDNDSPNWKIPYPYDEGIDWLMSPVTEKMGGHGEVEDGKIRTISVVPKPYTDPHPPVFVSSSASQATIEYCARKGFHPVYFSDINRVDRHANAYVAAGREVGREYAFGQNQATVRWLQFGETMDEARAKVIKYDVEIQKGLGYLLPNAMKDFYDVIRGSDQSFVDALVKSGLWIPGTIDQVRDEFVRQWKQVPAEYVVLIIHYAQQPKDSTIESLEKFMKYVKPALDEVVEEANAVGASAR